MARLQEYRSKRNFDRSPEPAGRAAARSRADEGMFVVHKHAARRLHYDLRLEHDGVFESWAVPKGPSLSPGEKRLAVRVEDHPLEYGEFEGVIPAGEYGAGAVMLWDRGRCKVSRREADQLDFELQGQKLRGAWSLVRMHKAGEEGGKNWLLIKRHDPESVAATRKGKQSSAERSVVTGRSMKQIAADRAHVWTTAGAPSAPEPPDPGALDGARRKALVRELRPQLATLAASAPTGEDWIHEIKFDGYRILARIADGKVQLLSRNGQDWTRRFGAIAALVKQLPAGNALLDGEIVAVGPGGVSSFRLLQEALSIRQTGELIYQLFDLLHLDGFDLGGVALESRKQALGQLLQLVGMSGTTQLRYTDHVEADGPAVFERACHLGLEGIVSKQRAATYRAGRSRQWLKTKCTRQEELVVGGYTDPGGTRTGFGALLLGAYRDSKLVYTGKVGTGFNEAELRRLATRLRKLETARCPFASRPAEKAAHWVRPQLIADVGFTEWTRDGLLRHPSFRGLREDKRPEEIQLVSASAPATKAAAESDSTAGGVRVAGVKISNPDRVLYPQQGVTKLALARYYESVARWMLPQVAERPLALLRCPQGRQKECFFQKHPGQALPKSLPRVEIEEQGGRQPYVYVRSAADLVALAQAGTLELHPWGSRVDDLERPDMLIFDLDPAPETPWPATLRAATSLRERLQKMGLESFVRTTGGKGLHVVVPLKPKLGWEEVKAFARAVAEQHARDDPKHLTTQLAKAKRQGRIFVDYLRNGRGATAIASYSTRAWEGAPVAVPLRWDELRPALKSNHYTIESVSRRLTTLRADPWEDFDASRRTLDARLLNHVGITGEARK